MQLVEEPKHPEKSALEQAVFFLLLAYVFVAPLIITTLVPIEALKWAIIQISGPGILALFIVAKVHRGTGQMRLDPIGVCLLAGLGVKALSLTDAPNPGLGWMAMSREFGLVCTYFVAAYACREARDRDSLLWSVVGVGLLTALYGIAQHFGFDFFPWQQHAEVPTARGSSWFGHATFSASVLIMTICLAMGLASTRTTFFARQGARVAVLLMLYHLYFSGARVATASLLATAVCVVLLAIWKTYREGRGDDFAPSTPLWRLGSITTLVIVLILGSFFMWRAIQEKDGGLIGTRRASLSQRVTTWETTSRMIWAHPINGVGADHFESMSPAYWNDLEANRYAAVQRPMTEAHNEYLERAAEEGLPGIAVMLALLCAGLFEAYAAFRLSPGFRAQRIGLALLAVLVANALDSLMIFNRQSAGSALVLYLVLALISFSYLQLREGIDKAEES